MCSLYVLELKNHKYYIGKSINVNSRLDDHFSNHGSVWTMIHKPIRVVEVIHNISKYDEDKYTIMYMDMYGIDNVRGGSFCKIKLPYNEKQLIIKMIHGANDKCFTCGRAHFIGKGRCWASPQIKKLLHLKYNLLTCIKRCDIQLSGQISILSLLECLHTTNIFADYDIPRLRRLCARLCVSHKNNIVKYNHFISNLIALFIRKI